MGTSWPDKKRYNNYTRAYGINVRGSWSAGSSRCSKRIVYDDIKRINVIERRQYARKAAEVIVPKLFQCSVEST